MVVTALLALAGGLAVTPPLDAAERAAWPGIEAPKPRPTAPRASLTSPLALVFDQQAATLSGSEQGRLAAVAETLAADPALGLRLTAYAAAAPRQARRLSLLRARAVHAFLVARGIDASRIEARALGDRADRPPRDRVDVQIVRR